PLAASVNCDRLTPSPAHDGVERDAKFREVIEALLEQVDPLASELAERWDVLKVNPGADESALRLCAMLGARKKQKAHPLLLLPLLTTTDGRGLSVGRLLEKQKAKEKIYVSEREGTL